MPFYLKKQCVGKVHSKYKNGLNVQFDNNLLYVGCSDAPLSAFGINIAAEKLKKILASVRIDDMVVNKVDMIIFYSIDGAVTVCCKDIEEMDLRLPTIKCVREDIVGTRLYKYLAKLDFEKMIGISLDEKTEYQLNLLVTGDKSNFEANRGNIRFFTGRGKGLTPSGDDILIGFTLALMLFGKFDTWQNALKTEVAVAKTTVISMAYLKAILQGYASEYFIRLAKLMDDAETSAIEKNIAELQSYGHTSGSDTLFGFFLGLKFLSRYQEGGA